MNFSQLRYFVKKKRAILLSFLFLLTAGASLAMALEPTCPAKHGKNWSFSVPESSDTLAVGIIRVDCDLLIFGNARREEKLLFARTFLSGKSLLTADEKKVVLPNQELLSIERLWRLAAAQALDATLPVRTPKDWISVKTALTTTPGQGCYFGPISHVLIRSATKEPVDGVNLVAKTVLKLKRSSRLVRFNKCMYVRDQTASILIESLEPLQAWPLQDGDFVVNFGNSYFLRIDGHLRSNADEIGKSIFLLDAPTELAGSPIQLMRRLPIVANSNAMCSSEIKGESCDFQTVHDLLISLIRQTPRRN